MYEKVEQSNCSRYFSSVCAMLVYYANGIDSAEDIFIQVGT